MCVCFPLQRDVDGNVPVDEGGPVKVGVVDGTPGGSPIVFCRKQSTPGK